MRDVFEEAADKAGVPENLREEVIARVVHDTRDGVLSALAEAMHDGMMAHLGA